MYASERKNHNNIVRYVVIIHANCLQETPIRGLASSDESIAISKTQSINFHEKVRANYFHELRSDQKI